MLFYPINNTHLRNDKEKKNNGSQPKKIYANSAFNL